MLRDQRLDFGAQLAVADQDQLELNALCRQMVRGFDQQELAFLRAQAADAD